jgi:chromosome segregation ATPase
MTRQVVLAIGFLVSYGLPVATYAQAGSPSGGVALDAVVREIRLLRQALEKQGSATARAQLLIARLTLQDERTARARQSVEKLEDHMGNLARERDQIEGAMRQVRHSLEQVSAEERRRDLEAEANMIRARLAEVQAQVSRTEQRLAQAKEALEIETGQYDELQAWLRDLDKQLQGGS